MTATMLHRIDPTRNMSRFYWLDLQPDLFGAWGVVREWGRIGRPGRLRVDPYPTESEAAAADPQAGQGIGVDRDNPALMADPNPGAAARTALASARAKPRP